MDFSAIADDLGRDPNAPPPEPPKPRSGGMSWLWALVAAIAAGAWCYYVIVNPTGTGGRTMAGNIKELDKAGFEAAIASGVTLVDFWAPWCGPCRAQAPILEEVQKALEGKASIAKLNVDDNEELAAQFDVASIPTLIVFKDGAEVHRYTGVRQKDELVAGITKHLGS